MNVLPRALILLKFLELRGFIRRFGRQLRTPTGALFGLFYALTVAFIVVPALLGRRSATDGFLAEEFAPHGIALVMALFCVISLVVPTSRAALHFKPAEVDFLFSGPYTRRQIISYKLAGLATGAIFMALLLSLSLLPLLHLWATAFVGFFLASYFVMLFGTAYSFFLSAISERFRYGGYALVAAVVYGCIRSIRSLYLDVLGAGGSPRTFWSDLINLPVIKAVSAPFTPFATVAAGIGPFSAWLSALAIALTMTVALYVMVLSLDADYMEASLARSAKFYARLERMRRGQTPLTGAGSIRVKWSIPRLPYAGGIGPIVWRQLTTFTRTGRVVTIFMLVLLSGGVAARYFEWLLPARDAALPILVAMMVYFTMLGLNFFRYDYRGDLDTFDAMKTLPISPHAIAAGQVIAPTLALTFLHLVFTLAVGIAFDRPDVFIITLIVAPAMNALMLGVENLTFLLWPTRMFVSGAADFQAMGRNMFTFFVKMIILLPAAGIAIGLGVLIHIIRGENWMLPYVVTSAVLAVEAAGMVPLVAIAFDRFDPSSDTPP